MKDKNTTSHGIGFIGLLTIAFIILKLTHIINWSWLWVLAPIWVEALLFVAVAVVVVRCSR